MDEACYREQQRLEMEYNGASEAPDDEYLAIQDTKDVFQNFVDQMYAQKYCSEDEKRQIEDLVAEVVAGYREMLQEEGWLSAETREAAIRKLDTLRVNVVYPEPDEMEDWSSVRFRSRAEGGNYTTAFSEVGLCKEEIERKNSYSAPNKNLWKRGASEIGAFYNPSGNEIFIHGALLNGVYYRDDMSREELLGTIGMTIGHEISHAFDMVGSQYDETGALKNWWTDSDRAAFERRSEKLIGYYDGLRPREGRLRLFWRDRSDRGGGRPVKSNALASSSQTRQNNP